MSLHSCGSVSDFTKESGKGAEDVRARRDALTAIGWCQDVIYRLAKEAGNFQG